MTDFNPRDLNWHPPALFPDYRSTRLRAPTHRLLQMPQTQTEKTGPVFGPQDIGPLDHDLIRNYAVNGAEAIGSRILVHGKLLDEDGRPVAGKLIEVWQANAGGRYRHVNDGYLAALDDNFGGCGRCLSGADGAYHFRTILPGPYPWPNGPNSWRPAHIHFSVFGDGFAQRLITQMYFEGDPHIKLCPIVNAIPDKRAVDRLTARLDMDATRPMDIRAYRFDIILRGQKVTPFETQGA